MKTVFPDKKRMQQERKWYLVDATDVVLGRLATRVANLLRGKRKPCFTAHLDCGDFVVVVNAAKVRLTGKKWSQKLAFRHSGYPGGARTTLYRELLAKTPERVVIRAVRGMLPKNKLRDDFLKKLKVYKDEHYPHQAQRPEPIDIRTLR